MTTIFDCAPFSALGNAMDMIASLEWEPESYLGGSFTMVSGYTLIEEITLLLLRWGYTMEEVARYRNVDYHAVYTTVRAINDRSGLKHWAGRYKKEVTDGTGKTME